MAVADYFRRSAVAVAQVLAGYDEDAIRSRLETKVVGIAFSSEAAKLPEGRALIDLSVRLLARLYPRLVLLGAEGYVLDDARTLAAAINPAIEIGAEQPDIMLGIGRVEAASLVNIFLGSSGWDAYLSTERPQELGETSNPFGAGAAACLGAANVFRAVFLGDRAELDQELTFSTLDMSVAGSAENVSIDGITVGDSNVLVGLGAIGNATVWALARTTLEGTLHLVDHQAVELSNLQRYVLALRSDDAQSKVEIAAAALSGTLTPAQHPVEWSTFVAAEGYEWQRVLVALDTARHRRAVQASLPRWIANAWTQPGDLGVSTHSWAEGACLSCLYLAEGELPNEDRLIATALGIARPDRELQIRNLLHSGGPPPREMLEEVAAKLEVPLELLIPFESRPLRELYIEGICAGAVLPLSRVGTPTQDVHVPIAHQSALAGVLLGARFVARVIGRVSEQAEVTRIDVLRALPQLIAPLAQPAGKDTRELCICHDPVYKDAYALKYSGLRKT